MFHFVQLYNISRNCFIGIYLNVKYVLCFQDVSVLSCWELNIVLNTTPSALSTTFEQTPYT